MKGTIRRCGPTNMSTLLAIVSGVLVNHQHQVLVEFESINHSGPPYLAQGLEPWCVEVSRVSGSVEQCRGSVGAVSVDTGVGCRAVSGCSVGQCRGSLTVETCVQCQGVKQCRSVGVSECRGVGPVSRCRSVDALHRRQAFSRKVASFDF